MIPLTPALLVASANAFVGRTQVHTLNASLVGLLEAGHAWCIAFLHYVGYWSHFETFRHGSSWPCPLVRSCAELGDFAAARGILRKDAHIGDVFLMFSHDRGCFAHTGVVVGAESLCRVGADDRLLTCMTVE